MDNKITFVKSKVEKHGKKFSLFFSIGILKTFLSIWLMWLLIDILDMKALLSSTIVVVIIFFTTYLFYVIAKVIKPEFIKYTLSSIGFNMITILLVSFFVDIIGLSGVVSSTIVIGTLFIVRYLFFNKIGLIYYG